MKRFIIYFVAICVLVIGAWFFVRSSESPDLKTTYPNDSVTVHQGQVLFERYCISCHAIREPGIGPRLGGITGLLTTQSLAAFIHNPSAVIASGESRAVRLRQQYKQEMPSFEFLNDSQIQSILSFVDVQSKIFHLGPLPVDTSSAPASVNRFAPPVHPSFTTIDIEDFIKIPRLSTSPDDKGVATLRAHPSGNGMLWVSDQQGVVYRIVDAHIDTLLFLKQRMGDFIDSPGIGTGLGSFAFHPGFMTNGLWYTTHAEKYTGKPAINDRAFPDSLGVGLQWVLTEWKMTDVFSTHFQGSNREVLRINTPTTAHGVQDIGFSPGRAPGDPDYGLLYLGIGDGGSNNIKHPELAHDRRSLLGTIIRIDPRSKSGRASYGIPSDNPFVTDADAATRKEIWAYGFRNPHRLCWDEQRLMVADIGESNVEEIDVVQKGGDYGWSTVEGNYGIATKVDLKSVYSLDDASRKLFKAPFGQYDHQDGNAISGGFVYHGKWKELNNTYFFGDIVTGRLFYMNIDPALSDSTVYDINVTYQGKPSSLQQIIHGRRVHLRIGYDPFRGDLYIMTKADGAIRKVSRVSGRLQEKTIPSASNAK